MSKIVKVTYNADTLQTTITVDGKVFDTSRIDGKEIADWAYPFMMRKIRWNGFYDEMVSALGGEKAFDLVFDGSDEALSELKEAWEDAPVNIVDESNGNSVEISYDENSLSVSVKVNGKAFDTSRIDGKEIEDWVYPFMMRKVKWDGIFEELAKAVGSDEYDIVFSGARNAMKSLMEECPETVTISYQKNGTSNQKASGGNKSQKNEPKSISADVNYDFELVRSLWDEEKYKEALPIVRSAAESGNVLAQSDLGVMYQLGWGVKFDISASLKWYLKAAEQGDSSCMESVAGIYAGQIKGSESFKNSKKAEEWFKKAENSCTDNDFDWNYYVEFLKDEGREREAFDVLKRWAKSGNTEALEELGAAYYFGPEDEYYGYSHILQNFNEARSCYFKASEKGSAIGKMRMGEFYLDGYGGVSQNSNRAFQYFSEAVEINDELPLAHRLLGECYLDGIGTNASVKKAKEHFKKAANYDSAKGMYYLGIIYRDENNSSQATKWLNKAGENGYSMAWVALGFMYMYGNSVKQNYQRAYEFMKRAAKENEEFGEYGLGLMFDNGYHVQQNYVKANERYCKAMEMGCLDAQVNYAINCLYSLGVSDSEEYGLKLLEEAAAEGSEDADEVLRQYYESVNSNSLIVKKNFFSKENIKNVKAYVQSDEGKEVVGEIAKGFVKGAKIGAKAGIAIGEGIATGNIGMVIGGLGTAVKEFNEEFSE